MSHDRKTRTLAAALGLLLAPQAAGLATEALGQEPRPATPPIALIPSPAVPPAASRTRPPADPALGRAGHVQQAPYGSPQVPSLSPPEKPVPVSPPAAPPTFVPAQGTPVVTTPSATPVIVTPASNPVLVQPAATTVMIGPTPPPNIVVATGMPAPPNVTAIAPPTAGAVAYGQPAVAAAPTTMMMMAAPAAAAPAPAVAAAPAGVPSLILNRPGPIRASLGALGRWLTRFGEPTVTMTSMSVPAIAQLPATAMGAPAPQPPIYAIPNPPEEFEPPVVRPSPQTPKHRLHWFGR